MAMRTMKATNGMATNGYTPTQQRMLEVLSDGQLHRPEELRACLNDDLQPIKHVTTHLAGIRKNLRLVHEDIVFQIIDGERYYRHVRFVSIRD
jgi:hypothetical protein